MLCKQLLKYGRVMNHSPFVPFSPKNHVKINNFKKVCKKVQGLNTFE